MLYISFLTYRGILFPTWLWMWYNGPTPDDLHPIEQTYPLVITSLFVLSCVWFISIHHGVVHLFTPGYYDKDGLHNGKMPTKAE